MIRHRVFDNIATGICGLLLVGLGAGFTLAVQPTAYQIVADANSSQFTSIVANRNSQIATVYPPVGSSTNHVLEYGPNLNVDFAAPNTRYLALDISNWGVAMEDDRGDRVNVAAAPIGQAPTDVFDTGFSGLVDIPELNDAGTIAFYMRPNNGSQQLYSLNVGSAPTLLPSVGQSEYYAVLVNQQGNVITRDEFTSPTYQQKFFRYDSVTGWTNITDGKLPPSIVIPSNSNVIGNQILGANGDFAFPGQVNLPNGKKQWQVLFYDESAQTILPIFDISSKQEVDYAGNPEVMDAHTTVGDQGQVWIAARRSYYPYPTEFKTLYRNTAGQSIDLESLLPAGLTLRQSEQYDSMNYAGDVWLGAVDKNSGLYSYFLYSGGTLMPVFRNTTLDIYGATLTNSRDLYFWLFNGPSADLAVLRSVPEPTTLSMSALLIVFVASLRRRHV